MARLLGIIEMTLPPLTLPLDKCLHFIVGVLIYAVAHFISPIIGLVAVAIAAVGKEVYDRYNKGTVDLWDAVATIAGGLIGWTCSLSL